MIFLSNLQVLTVNCQNSSFDSVIAANDCYEFERLIPFQRTIIRTLRIYLYIQISYVSPYVALQKLISFLIEIIPSLADLI